MTSVRAPAQAGRFYPLARAAIDRALDEYLPSPSSVRRTCRAVMLPHAGWVYCGGVIGAVLDGTDVPATAIVIGPRHTGRGARLSVAPHDAWDLPGDRVPLDLALVRACRARFPALVAEPEAHAAEHGVEVLLPFLRRARPDLAVVPIAMGALGLDEVLAFGRALAAVVASLAVPPWFVISSDMNHFADDATTRRLDALALDALATGDPRVLHDVVRRHDISMCGVLPAVCVLEALRTLDPGRAVNAERVAYATSADTSGDTTRVVGYAGVRLV